MFLGADADGMQKFANKCLKAAGIADKARLILEVLVAAQFFFGPFGAAFVKLLLTIIKWLKRIAQMLRTFANVLNGNALAQIAASAANHLDRFTDQVAQSLPVYRTPPLLPAGSPQQIAQRVLSAGANGNTIVRDTFNDLLGRVPVTLPAVPAGTPVPAGVPAGIFRAPATTPPFVPDGQPGVNGQPYRPPS